jgi:hypothetical protein
MKKFITGVILIMILSGCYGTYYISDSEYDDAREEHTSLTYWDNEIYWGWHSGYYYYYGVPHIYPWWYYYTLIPHHTYTVHTHITIFCDNGYYVSTPRGPKFNNNRGGTYKPNVKTVKPNRTNIRTNIKTNSNRIKIKTNSNRTNIKVNTNRTNVKTNRSNKNKTNVKINRTNSNKSNNKTFNNRSNKTNNRKNTRKPR